MMGDDGDTDKDCQVIQTANDMAEALAHAKYDSQWLQAMFKVEEEEDISITQPYTLEIQMVLVADARSHGGWFKMSNRGTHVTHNNIFISIEMIIRSIERTKLAYQKEKKSCLCRQKLEEKAFAILWQEKRTVK